MLTVNLEKKLVKENKKLLTPEQLLIVNEYDKLENDPNKGILKLVGLGSNLVAGAAIENKLESELAGTRTFDQGRVFHISQIKAVCDEYYLRFLNADYYKGTIDAGLSLCITMFEKDHNLRQPLTPDPVYKVMAPSTSFRLCSTPHDPLFFYKINDDYYYLVYKWGKDLTITRKLVAKFQSRLFTFGVMITIFIALILPVAIIRPATDSTAEIVCLLLFMLGSIGLLLSTVAGAVAFGDGDGFGFRFLAKNEYDSIKEFLE